MYDVKEAIENQIYRYIEDYLELNNIRLATNIKTHKARLFFLTQELQSAYYRLRLHKDNRYSLFSDDDIITLDGTTWKNKLGSTNYRQIRNLFFLYVGGHRQPTKYQKGATSQYILKSEVKTTIHERVSIEFIKPLDTNNNFLRWTKKAIPPKWLGTDIGTNIEPAIEETGSIYIVKQCLSEYFNTPESSRDYTPSKLLKELGYDKKIKNDSQALQGLEKLRYYLIEIEKPIIFTNMQAPIIQNYDIGRNGRLYMNKFISEYKNLLNMPRFIRKMLFNRQGYTDIDIQNCHPTLLHYYHKMVVGHEYNEMKEYLANYKKYRYTLSDEVDISYITAKKILMTRFYKGNSFDTSKYYSSDYLKRKVKAVWDAVYEEVGNDDDTQAILYGIYESPTFNHIESIIDRIYTDIKDVADSGKNVYGKEGSYYINLKGGKLLVKDKKGKSPRQNQIMSHILTGIEATILQKCIVQDIDRVISVFHDGWVVNEYDDTYADWIEKNIPKKVSKEMKRWNKRFGNPLNSVEDIQFSLSYDEFSPPYTKDYYGLYCKLKNTRKEANTAK